ncbi:MAG: ComEC/Rec2 family competence protein [Clostridia bacterium]|nr:ComEC/Rec2 family competence protein [Clostridia bacterium]
MKSFTGEKESVTAVEERFCNFRPGFFFGVLFSLGIVFSYFVIFDGASGWWALLLLPIPVCAVIFYGVRLKTLVALLSLAVAFVLGFSLFSARTQEFEDGKTIEGEYTVVGTVVEKWENDDYGAVVLSDIYIGEKPSDFKFTAYLSASFLKNIALSDRLVLRGFVRTLTDTYPDDGFLASEIADGKKYFSNAVESVQKAGEETDLFLLVRARIEEVVQAGMDEDSAALTLALLLGNTSGIEEGMLENIRAGGIAHIFAVSGLHIAALYAFCRLLTDKTGFSRAPAWLRFVFVATVVLFYGGICGFSSSVVRAIVMCLVTYLCRLLWINYDLLDSLGVAAAVVLCFSPTLLFEIGFQLSFTACLGIGFLSGVIFRSLGGRAYWLNNLLIGKEELAFRAKRKKRRVPLGVTASVWKSFARVVSVSVAAQLGTLPVQLNAFGYLSGWGLLLNFFFVPLISAAFAFLLFLVLFTALLPTAIAGVTLYVPAVIWSALSLLFVAVDFSDFLLVGSMPFGATLAHYVFLLTLSDKLNVKGAKPIFVLLFLLLTLFAAFAPYFI